MTLQELFDKVATHLLTQNAKADDGNNHCQYRTNTGLMCAAGCLLDAESYKKVNEGMPVNNHSNRGLFESIIGESNIGHLRQLQSIHDCDEVENWPDKLAEFAKDNYLNADVLAISIVHRIG